MNEFFAKVFTPPPFPPIDLGRLARVSGVEKTLKDAFEVAYFTGVKDGLLWGVIFSLAFVVVLHLWRPGMRQVTNVLP